MSGIEEPRQTKKRLDPVSVRGLERENHLVGGMNHVTIALLWQCDSDCSTLVLVQQTSQP